MKYKYFVGRLYGYNPTTQGFVITRGDNFETEYLEGLALVRLADIKDNTKFTGLYSIIDIESGLKVFSAKSKKRLLEIWEQRKSDEDYRLKEKIIDARNSSYYNERVNYANEARKHFRSEGFKL